MRLESALFGILFLFAASTSIDARQWTSAVGGYTLDAAVIASNEVDVILKRSDGKLVAVRQDELSEGDRAYLKSKEASDQVSESLDGMHTWTSKDGLKIRGKVLSYGRKDYTLTRNRGKVVINNVRFGDLDDLHQRLLLLSLSDLESQQLTSEQDLNRWALSIAGKPKTYTIEGVLMELESSDQIPVPFFLFSDDDIEVLRPGWENWVKAHQNEQARQHESLMMQAEANEYQRQRNELEYQRQQIEYLRMNMLAARTGLTSIWEVGLEPPPGVYGRRTSVMVTARDSLTASQMAQSQYPGYRIFGVRRASR
ncbi:MAG: SHD1 domain-containing protein [Planctomycetota bacterium]